MPSDISNYKLAAQSKVNQFADNPVGAVRNITAPLRSTAAQLSQGGENIANGAAPTMATWLSNTTMPVGAKSVPSMLIKSSFFLNQKIDQLACKLYKPVPTIPGNYRILPAVLGIAIHGLAGVTQGLVIFAGIGAAMLYTTAKLMLKTTLIGLAALLLFLPYKLLTSKNKPTLATIDMLPVDATTMTDAMPSADNSNGQQPKAPQAQITSEQIKLMEQMGMI